MQFEQQFADLVGEDWDMFDLLYPGNIEINVLIKDLKDAFPNASIHEFTDAGKIANLEITFHFSSREEWKTFFKKYFVFLIKRDILGYSFWMQLDASQRTPRYTKCMAEYVAMI